MKKDIIHKLNEEISKKMQQQNSKYYCLRVLKDIEINMEDSEVEQLIAKNKDGKISYKIKSFFHTMREFQEREQKIKYIDVDLNNFDEKFLIDLLEDVENRI